MRCVIDKSIILYKAHLIRREIVYYDVLLEISKIVIRISFIYYG